MKKVNVLGFQDMERLTEQITVLGFTYKYHGAGISFCSLFIKTLKLARKSWENLICMQCNALTQYFFSESFEEKFRGIEELFEFFSRGQHRLFLSQTDRFY